MKRISGILGFVFISLVFPGASQAQSDDDYLELSDGEQVPGTVSIVYESERSTIKRLRVNGTLYEPNEVHGYRRASDYYRLLERSETVTRRVAGTRLQTEALRFRLLKRCVEGSLSLYSQNLERDETPPCDYFARDGGTLYKVNVKNLRRAMGEHPPSRSYVRRAENWRRARNVAFGMGLGLTAWGVNRGLKFKDNPEDSERIPVTFELNIPLLLGVVSSVASYIFDRRVEGLLEKGIQRFNADYSADYGTEERFPERLKERAEK